MKPKLSLQVLFFLLGLAIAGIPAAGTTQEVPDPPATSAADPSDVESVDAIVAAVYDVISGPAGEARDWDRWRSLFIPEARLIAVGRAPEGASQYRVMTPEDYVQSSGSFLEQNGFFEQEIGRTQEEFGPVVHLFSAYQSKRTLEDEEPFARGINSFQLLHDGARWWVVTIYWTSERPDLPIPAKYLSGGG
jgi:hypothetical protein